MPMRLMEWYMYIAYSIKVRKVLFCFVLLWLSLQVAKNDQFIHIQQ